MRRLEGNINGPVTGLGRRLFATMGATSGLQTTRAQRHRHAYKRRDEAALCTVQPYAPRCSHRGVLRLSRAVVAAGLVSMGRGTACAALSSSLPPPSTHPQRPPALGTGLGTGTGTCPRHAPACFPSSVAVLCCSPHAATRRATSICPRCASVETTSGYFLRRHRFRHSFVRLQPPASSTQSVRSS
jgi:hypothetical protein